VDIEHIVIPKMFEKVNFSLKGREERQPTKKIMIEFGRSIFIKDSFKKKDVPQKQFLKNFGLLIVKNNLPIQFVESMWLKRLILCICPKLNFPFRR